MIAHPTLGPTAGTPWNTMHACLAQPPFPRIQPCGDAALRVELGDRIDPDVNARVHHLASQAQHLPGVIETVPGYATLLVHHAPDLNDPQKLQREIEALASQPALALAPGTLHEVPVRYDGQDLPRVADRLGLTPAQVVALHTSVELRVYLLGFAPGFAYLGGLPRALHLPRLPTPRQLVPAGSVLLGGAQTAVLPVAMPSGWHILGTTRVQPFDLARDPPFLLQPGDRVRFVQEG